MLKAAGIYKMEDGTGLECQTRRDPGEKGCETEVSG